MSIKGVGLFPELFELGLGLLMTKKIVQEHAGHIDMQSEPGQGTTFRIVLPRKRLPKPVEPEGETELVRNV